MSRYDVIEWLAGTFIVTALVCWAVDRFQKNRASDPVIREWAGLYDMTERDWELLKQRTMEALAADREAAERRGRIHVVPEVPQSAEVIEFTRRRGGAA